MKRALPQVLAIALTGLAMASCNKQDADWGTASYQPQFLWDKGSVTPIEKTIDLEFSPDAKRDPNTQAEFQFTDNAGTPISTQEMRIVVNGDSLKDNKFTVQSDASSIGLKIYFTPQAKGGKHQGLLKMTGHALDRVDSQTITPGQCVEVAQWTMTYDKQMNPLAKLMMYIALGIVVLLLVWKALISRQTFPRFKKCRKTLKIKQNGKIVKQASITFTGKRMVVLTNKKQAQSFTSRFFTGEVQYIVHPAFTSDLTFIPSKGRRGGIRARGMGYIAQPYIIPLNGKATVSNSGAKLEIDIY